MPLYEYECSACGHRFELIQRFSDAAIEQCPNCGELQVKKLVSSPAIQFKGTGWYITDYAKKGESAKESNKESGKESKESGKESSKESRESKESTKESRESTKPSTESKSPTSTRTPKASGE